MFNFTYKFLFFSFLIMGTIMTMSSNTWFMAWMGLEINIMAFIPLLAYHSSLSAEATLKYFLIQTVGSIILLFSAILILFLWNFQMIYNNFINMMNIMIECSLMLKLGAAPFHLWFIHIMNGLSWNNSMIMLTWQKIAPMTLLFMLHNSYLLWFVVILSSIIGALGGLNHMSLRKILSFSSINHISWMLSAMIMNKTLFILYFLIYSISSITIIMMMNMMKMSFLTQLFIFMKNKIMYKISFAFSFFSLGGLPPFLGFIPKWMILNTLLINTFFLIPFILILSALISLLYYIRMSYSLILINLFSKQWTNFSMENLTMKICMILFINISLLPLGIFIPI